MLDKHYAFKEAFAGRPKEITTQSQVGHPSSTHPDSAQKIFKSFYAIWDTGATCTVITKAVVDALGLKPTGITDICTPNGKSTVETYLIDLILPSNVMFPNLNVALCELEGKSEVLIGMDVIQMGDFSISNSSGFTTFSYCIPPIEGVNVDLKELCDKANEDKVAE